MKDDLAPVTWRKSTFSNDTGACVEVADLATGTGVRDSKLGDASPVLSVTTTQWAAFTAGLRGGQFD
jgi:uncharacterized protein DUF397